jgi:tetratricopeptide (TPR) repeat protein
MLKGGRLLSSVRETLLRVFPCVTVLDDAEYVGNDDHAGHRTFVLVASGRPVDLKGLEMAGTDGEHDAVAEVPAETIAREQDPAGKIVLSDGYAPMEILLAPVVRQGNAARAGQILFRYASYCLAKNDIPKAERLLEKSLVLNPELGEAHAQLGLLAAKRGDLAGAERHFRETVRLSPWKVSVRINYANTLARQGKTAEAFREFSEALKLDPGNSVLHINLAVYYYQQGNFQKARELLVKAKRLDPENPEIDKWIGMFDRRTPSLGR